MAANLLIAAGLGLGCWLAAHAYQHKRFSDFESDDAKMLAADASPERDEWVAAVRQQVGMAGVSPACVRALSDAGVLSHEEAATAFEGAYARRYDPTLEADLRWLPCYMAAALVGSMWNLPAALFCCMAVAIAQADTRFRIVPVPWAIIMAASGAVAFWGASSGALAVALMAAGSILFIGIIKVFERIVGVGGVCGSGDAILLSVAACALIPTGRLTLFLILFAVCGAACCAWARARGKGPWFKTALAPIAALPLVCCLAVI